MESDLVTPAYSKAGHTIYQGDCVEVLKVIPERSVNLIFADPPYNIGKSFGNNKDSWPSKEEYLKWSRTWLEQCSRVLRSDGSLFVMGHPQYVPFFMDFLEELGLHFTNQIIYHYTDGMPEADRFERRYEPILYYRMDKERYTFNLDSVRINPIRFDKFSNPRGKNPSDVWEINRVRWNSKERISLPSGKIAHVAQKPLKLLDRIILATTNLNETVLDPFLGTGTTSVAAKIRSRRSIGIEINPEYVKIAIQRLEQTKADEFSPTQIFSNIQSIEEDFKKIDEWVIPRDRTGFRLTNDFHPYFAAFPPELVDRLLESYSRPGHVVLDPFCGGGSAVVESVVNERPAIGIDISPLAVLITKVKATPFAIDRAELSSFVDNLKNEILQLNMQGGTDESVPVPNRSFLERWYPIGNLYQLGVILRSISRVENSNLRDFLRVAFSSILRKTSFSKNAEQHLSRAPDKKPLEASRVFLEKVSLMTEQMDKFYEIARDKPKPRVMTGDARRISEILGGEQVDLVVTSPPYGTGSKYSEVYRLSFEWLSLQRPPRSESLERSSSFAAELRTCIQEIYKSLKPNKYLCFVYGDPSAENGLTRQAVADAKEAGFVFRGLISCPIAKEKYNHGTTYRRFIPKDFVLIFQK